MSTSSDMKFSLFNAPRFGVLYMAALELMQGPGQLFNEDRVTVHPPQKKRSLKLHGLRPGFSQFSVPDAAAARRRGSTLPRPSHASLRAGPPFKPWPERLRCLVHKPRHWPQPLCSRTGPRRHVDSLLFISIKHIPPPQLLDFAACLFPFRMMKCLPLSSLKIQ